MKKTITALTLTGSLAGILLVGACTQMPTEKQGVADLRPQISFKAADERWHGARVLLDDLDMGAVGDYVDGSAALRILSGAHLLRVVAGNQIIFEEKFYAGDGVNRTFTVK